NDGATDSNIGTALIQVVGDHTDSPVLDLDANNSSGAAGANYQTSFTEGGGAIKVADADATISDSDDTNLESMTVTLTNAPNVGETVSLTTAGFTLATSLGLEVATQSSGTVLTISGSATKAQYQQLLTEVVYNNAANGPSEDLVRQV